MLLPQSAAIIHQIDRQKEGWKAGSIIIYYDSVRTSFTSLLLQELLLSSVYHISSLALVLQFCSSTNSPLVNSPSFLVNYKKGLEKVRQQSGRLRAIPNGFSAAPKSQKCSEIFLFKIRQFLNRLRVAANLFFPSPVSSDIFLDRNPP